MIWGATRRRARVDAYTQWRSERNAGHAAYRVWSPAGVLGGLPTVETYQWAPDREERAATTSANPMTRVWAPTAAETGPAHQLARMQALPGAW